MCAVLLVPVLLRVLSHVSGRGVGGRLIGTVPGAGGLQRGAVFHVAAAAVVVVPHRRGRRGVTGHGVAGIWTVFQRDLPKRKLSVLVELLELGATVLEPDFDLEGEASKVEEKMLN